MLINALFHTNRFIVLERDKLHVVMSEQNIGASARFNKDTAAAAGQLEGAEILVTAAITGFDPGAGGAEGTLSSLLKSNLGSVFGSVQRAHISMDLRLIDTRTGRILNATSVDGSATSFTPGVASVGGPMSGSLSHFSKTPMDTAIREMLKKAGEFISTQTPKKYYHYSENDKAVK